MKILIIAAILSISFAASAQSVYDFKVEGIDGTPINLADYKGKKIMMVNTASKCGNTPQYDDLEKLYEQHKGNLVIIGFPANNFGSQEPGSNEEIAEFCKKNYGVSFPLSAKVSVKGEGIDPLFKYLTEEAEKKGFTDPIKWNFTKFLVNENGELVTVFHHKTLPLSDDILKHLN
ncbi:MAG: glutathione peroxidase [Chitinophagaceae bacterium]|jgi:glutathione peroxidase|nr:glutathione peroxidase [Chitinophagaceae bacterium]